MQHQTAGVEIAGVDNAAPNYNGGICGSAREMRDQIPEGGIWNRQCDIHSCRNGLAVTNTAVFRQVQLQTY